MSRRRWLIESLTNDDWEVIGSIDATSPEEAAYAASGWAEARGRKLQAIAWEQATVKDRAAAEYEDDMRFRQWQALGGRGTLEYSATHGEPALTVEQFHAMNRYVRRRRSSRLGWAVLAAVIAP